MTLTDQVRQMASAPRSGLPAWANPGALMALCGARQTDVVVGLAAFATAAKADPKRVAIGFAGSTTGLSAIKVRPGGDPNVAGFAINQAAADNWFTLFTHGPFVNQEWRAYATTGGTLVVFEVYLLS